MSVSGITNQTPIPTVSKTGGSERSTGAAAGATYSEIALQVAGFQAQTLGSLINTAFASGPSASPSSVEGLLASLNSAAARPTAPSSGTAIGGLSPTGRNSALLAPEPAYQMMSFINAREVTFQAEFAELSQMQSAVADMQQNARRLAGIDGSSDNASIKAQLQTFADQYNTWVRRFDTAMQEGGPLADVQAAQVSRHELAQSIGSIFNGARQGVHGLRDLGFDIDPVSKLATFDSARLDSTLASNKAGAVLAVQEFSANFVKSAELLNSDGNFIKNRLDNLARAIAYIGENKPALQAEFGLGDPARPDKQLAQSLAAYQQMAGV